LTRGKRRGLVAGMRKDEAVRVAVDGLEESVRARVSAAYGRSLRTVRRSLEDTGRARDARLADDLTRREDLLEQ
jgi:hypothetical protein